MDILFSAYTKLEEYEEVAPSFMVFLIYGRGQVRINVTVRQR